MNILGIHLNHDSTLSFSIGGTFKNIELERIYDRRHFDWREERGPLEELVALVRSECAEIDRAVTIGSRDETAERLIDRLQIARRQRVDHHVAHSAAAFYQSTFDQALVVSYDGGGNDGTFRAFLARRGERWQAIGTGWKLNLGIPYRALGYAICELAKPNDLRELSNAGKLMGLVAYGTPRREWLAAVREYYYASSRPAPRGIRTYEWIVSTQLPALGRKMGLPLSRNAISGRDAADLAATGQRVLEDLFLDHVSPLVAKHRMPICLSGGCALNVVTNQRLAELTD